MYNSLTTVCPHLDMLKYDLVLEFINPPLPAPSQSLTGLYHINAYDA